MLICQRSLTCQALRIKWGVPQIRITRIVKGQVSPLSSQPITVPKLFGWANTRQQNQHVPMNTSAQESCSQISLRKTALCESLGDSHYTVALTLLGKDSGDLKIMAWNYVLC